MNQQELSSIEHYRAQWEPDKKRIAELEAELAQAKAAGDAEACLALLEDLWFAWRPPSNLPIKGLDYP